MQKETRETMLKRLTIENFQAHKSLTVDFDPLVTTIIGPSDVGKSAVIRALVWLATNKPAGNSFIREGSNQTKITLEVDKHNIQRIRGKSENSYILDGQEFKSFISDVPDEILKILNLSPTNFQQQHDNPFWFSETAGEVSRQLNQIVDLSIIDSTLTYLDKAVRESHTKIKVVKTQLEEAKALRSSLSWAKKAEKDFLSLENTEKTWKAVAESQQKLKNLVTNVLSHRDSTKVAGEALEVARNTVHSGNMWKEKYTQVRSLQQLTSDVGEMQKKVNQHVPDINPLTDLWAKVEKAKAKPDWLRVLVEDITQAKKCAVAAANDADKAHKQFEKEMGDVCPLCGNKL